MPKHEERKDLPYTAEQMFALVADVAKYPQFLPWCVGARVRKNDGTEMLADLTIGFGPFRESFGSRVSLTPAQADGPSAIRVTYENGPFKYLTNAWDFVPREGGCEVQFFVDFEFRNAILQKAIGAVFTEAVHRMVQAFLKRAEVVYAT